MRVGQGVTVTFTGGGCTDPEGNPLESCLIDFGCGCPREDYSGGSASHYYTVPGIYTIRIIGEDDCHEVTERVVLPQVVIFDRINESPTAIIEYSFDDGITWNSGDNVIGGTPPVEMDLRVMCSDSDGDIATCNLYIEASSPMPGVPGVMMTLHDEPGFSEDDWFNLDNQIFNNSSRVTLIASDNEGAQAIDIMNLMVTLIVIPVGFAEWQLLDVTVDPKSVYLDDVVTADVRVKNIGDFTGTALVRSQVKDLTTGLFLEGFNLSDSITLDPDEAGTLQLTFPIISDPFEVDGSYAFVAILEEQSGQDDFSVLEEPEEPINIPETSIELVILVGLVVAAILLRMQRKKKK